MRRKSGSFEIIRKVLKNEVEVIVTRKLKIMFLQFDCTKEYLSYMFSECMMSCERGFINMHLPEHHCKWKVRGDVIKPFMTW